MKSLVTTATAEDLPMLLAAVAWRLRQCAQDLATPAQTNTPAVAQAVEQAQDVILACAQDLAQLLARCDAAGANASSLQTRHPKHPDGSGPAHFNAAPAACPAIGDSTADPAQSQGRHTSHG